TEKPRPVIGRAATTPSCSVLGSRFSVHHFLSFVAVLLFLGPLAQAAQPPGPPPPAKYQVVLRYRIAAARDQHVVQYDAMIDHLRKLGFEFNPPLDQAPDTDREDRSKNYLRGAIASDRFVRILADASA